MIVTNITQYRQYGLWKRLDNGKRMQSLTCWLANPNLKKGMRVKIGDDKTWWTVGKVFEVIKQQNEYQDISAWDGWYFKDLTIKM